MQAITRIAPSSEWLAAPALSVNRIRIEYNGEYLLVPPRRQ